MLSPLCRRHSGLAAGGDLREVLVEGGEADAEQESLVIGIL